MANTKIPSVLWNVDQHSVLSAENRTQAQANVGIGSGMVKSSATANKFVTHISRDDSGDLNANVGQPGLGDLAASTANRSVVTDNSGNVGVADLTYSSSTASGNTLAFIDSVSQGANGQISATKKNVTVDSTYSATGTNPINGTALKLAITAENLVSDANYNQLKSKVDGIEAGAEVNVQSNWNETNSSSDAFILNKPVVIEGQIKLMQYGTKQFKNLTIDYSEFAGTPAAVSVTSTEDTTYTPGYLVPRADSANKYLCSGTGGVTRWEDLDMGTYDEYEDEQTSTTEELSRIYVEKLYNGNERIKFNNESSYKYLVPQPSPNKQLVTTSGGVMQWDTINANISVHEIAYRESSGTQADSTIYNDVSDDVDSGKTPMLWSAGDYGNKYFYIFKRRTGGSQHGTQQITYLFEGNETFQNRIIRKLITSGTITTEVVPLQGRLTAGSGIAIDNNTNEIMCTGSGQVVDGIFKQVDSGSTRYTIQFGIGDQNNQFLDLVKTDTSTNPNRTLSATHIDEEEVQSNSLALMPLGSNSYRTNFWMSPHNTTGGQENPGRTSEVCQLPTAIHSVYDGTLSAEGPGSQEMPIDRVTLYGNTSHSFVKNNLGNLTVGSLAMRIVDSTNTSAEHPLLASCVQGELTFARVSNNKPLYTKHYDAVCSYVQAGDSEYDGWLALTTAPRTLSDADARSAGQTANGLGCLTFFPSKNYVDDKDRSLSARIGTMENKSYFLDIDNRIANNRMIFTLSGETASGGTGYVDIELLPDIETALGKSTGYIRTHTVHAFVIATVTIDSGINVDVDLVPVPAGGIASSAVHTWSKAGHGEPYTIAFPVISLTEGLYLRCHYSTLTAWTCKYTIDCTVIPCDALSV